MNTLSLSVVIPVFNSEGILPDLVRRLEPVLAARAGYFELILVNDGSRDRSWEVILDLCAGHQWIRGINLMRNYGQHNALLCGIRAAKHEIIATMDDDLQHPPEELPKILDKLAMGFDVVYGIPEKEQHGLWRDIASQISKLVLQNAMGAQIARSITAFRAFRRQVREAFAGYQSPHVSIDVLLTWGTTRFAAIPVRHAPRFSGRSNYTFGKLLMHALNMMTGFSTIPLRVASLVGFLLTLFGLAVLGYVIGRYLFQGSVIPGFAFLASIIAIFSGVQSLVLGIMGEYLLRMHFRTMERPPYAIREESPAGGSRGQEGG